MLFITWNDILVVLCMHMIKFFFLDWVILFLLLLLHGSLRMGDSTVIWKNIQPKMDMKVLKKMLCFLESEESVREQNVISFSEKRITKAVRGRGKWNIQHVYGQNEGYVQGGRVLIVLDFVKLMDGRFSFKGDAPVFWKRRVGTQTHHESFEKQDYIWKARFH